MNFPDYYDMLGLPRFYPTQEEIRDAFLHKVVELNASGEVDPEARQMLDSAYVTLSDTKKKREYDEVLARYLEAEESVRPEKVVISAYDYTDTYTEKRTVSISLLSKRIYDFLADKVQELTEISSRYPFTSESDIEQRAFFEKGMLILSVVFSMVYFEDFSKAEIMQFWNDAISLMVLQYPVDISKTRKQELTLILGFLVDEFIKVNEKHFSDDEQIFDYMADVYIIQTSSGDDIDDKIKRPDFFEAFLSMEREVSEFWKRFFMEKEFVT